MTNAITLEIRPSPETRPIVLEGKYQGEAALYEVHAVWVTRSGLPWKATYIKPFNSFAEGWKAKESIERRLTQMPKPKLDPKYWRGLGEEKELTIDDVGFAAYKFDRPTDDPIDWNEAREKSHTAKGSLVDEYNIYADSGDERPIY